MPADPAALTALGAAHPTAYSNSTIVPDPVLAPLTDIFALPTWVPFSNVFSIGDVLIGVGVGDRDRHGDARVGSTVDGRGSAARRRLNGAVGCPARPVRADNSPEMRWGTGTTGVSALGDG